MDKNELNATLLKAQTDAQVNMMKAQHEHEVGTALANVRHLSSQITARTKTLAALVEDVERAAVFAEDGETFRYARGAFGSDTDTLDTLLSALGEAVEGLANLRARHRAIEEQANAAAESMISAMSEPGAEGQPPAPEQVAIPMPMGQYL